MEIHMDKVEGDAEMTNCNAVNNSEVCRRNELEERSEKAEARCVELESELQKKNKYCEALEAKLNALEEAKIAIDDKLKFVSILSEGLEGNQLSNEREKEKKKDVYLEGENEWEDKVFQLTVEIRVLENEKKKAESEVQVWKERFKKLESRALESGLKWANLDFCDGNGKKDCVQVRPVGHSHLGTSLNILQNQGKFVNLDDVASYNSLSAGTPSNETCWRNLIHSKAQPYGRARRHLAFESKQSPSKKMAPSTPMGAKPASICVVNITDSDDEPSITQQPVLDNQDSGSISFSTFFAAEKEKLSDDSLKGSFYVENNEDLNFAANFPFSAMPKRKRTCNVVTSESESDDDSVPISKLKKTHILKVSPDQVRCDLNESVTAASSVGDKVTGTTTPRRRLVPLRKCVIKSQEDIESSHGPSEDKHKQSIPTTEDNDDDELEEVLSGSEEESLRNFIINDSDVSDYEDTSSKSPDASDGEVDSDSQDASDGDLNFSEILSRIQRNNDQKMKWEFEADMLAAFGKDPQLCMKAVCTLYRQQTSDEQRSKGSLYHNRRGFSNIDALRGSSLAEFLTDGDALSDLKKSVKELKEYDPKAVELCRTMAIRYSKQLFEIYKNKEDPFFR